MLVRLLQLSLIIQVFTWCLSSPCVWAGDQEKKALVVEKLSPADRFDNGDKWAILIGVNKYSDPQISSLKYCVSDVRLLEKVLEKKCGYDKDHIVVISDDQQTPKNKPLLVNLKTQIRSLISKVKKGDTVLLYFSGHSFLDNRGHLYLVPNNCRLDQLATSGFALKELTEILNDCATPQKILILDSCQSNQGKTGARGIKTGGSTGRNMHKRSGLITFLSCSNNEVSMEWPEKKQGLFTYYLAEGLGGAADKNQDGIIDSNEIYDYLLQKVPPAASKIFGVKQTPVRIISPDVEGVYSLARVTNSTESFLPSHTANDRISSPHIEPLSPLARFDQGEKWAVLIGVNEYLDESINNLKYCVSDARLMEKILVENCGYKKDHILVIADDQQRTHLRPLLTNLKVQIQNWLSNAKKGDTVLVFFSGHGFLDDELQGYLAPSNCQRKNLAFWGFRTDDLRNSLRVCEATQKIMILDCCHSGGKGDNDSPTSSEEVAATFKHAEGLITLASSRKKQQSQEWDRMKQGLFTYYLAEGLGGQADKDKNGIVDSDEIYNYTYKNVRLTARRELNKSQDPVRIIGEDVGGLFGLSRVSVSNRPQMELDNSNALLQVTVRTEDTSRPLVANATVELLYRSTREDQPVSLARGTTNVDGNVRLKVKLTAEQQIRGDLLALVKKGESSLLWKLTGFPSQSKWELTVPNMVEEKPSLLNAPFSKQEANAKQAAWAKYLKTEVTITNSIGMKLTLIPAGEFMMGSSISVEAIAKQFNYSEAKYFENEYPQHSVQISKPYYLGTTEVTQGQWKSVMGTTPWKGKIHVKEGDAYPASFVSWDMIQEFIQRLNQKESMVYRLPTEAEWEHSCRAGSQTIYNFGKDSKLLNEYEWSGRNAMGAGEDYAHQVAQKKANLFGLYDMHGNVPEWCQDWYKEEYYRISPPSNPTGPLSGSRRVTRGGGWMNPEVYCRGAVRSGLDPSDSSIYIGFRLALSPIETD